MENASKALIIAGGVLLAIMILSMGIYLFQNAGLLSNSYNEKLAQDEINGFNNKFLVYAKNINAQEMVSLINLIKENNIKNEFVPEKQIHLYIDSVSVDFNSYSEEKMIDMMQATKVDEEGIYKFISVEYHTSGYIKIIKYKI